MDIIGIICEYNPFHNGHLYHLKKIKELYPNSLIILVLNGLFLQRGEISIITKKNKTILALENNIDLVLELPIIFGTQSADIFADCAVKILNNFHVTKIVIGSESNNSQLLKEVATASLNNFAYDLKIKKYLKQGLNYPASLAKALNIKQEANDLLGISYAKSIIKNKLAIDLITIQRTSNYHDLKSDKHIISATNIRKKLKTNNDIAKYVPKSTLNYIENINFNKYYELLKYKINISSLTNLLDINEGIEYRLKKYLDSSSNLDSFINQIKTKRYTYNKINRLLIHILLEIPQNINNTTLDYIKVLGFNKRGQKYLNMIKKNLVIPTIINKKSLIYHYECLASKIYDLINNTNTYSFELINKPILKIK